MDDDKRKIDVSAGVPEDMAIIIGGARVFLPSSYLNHFPATKNPTVNIADDHDCDYEVMAQTVFTINEMYSIRLFIQTKIDNRFIFTCSVCYMNRTATHTAGKAMKHGAGGEEIGVHRFTPALENASISIKLISFLSCLVPKLKSVA